MSARHRNGYTLPLVLVALLAAGVGTAYYLAQSGNSEESGDGDAILHTAARSDFRLTVTERGEIESSGVTEIRSEVKTKNTTGMAILRVVPEGTVVEAGDFLVELDSSALAEELTTQQIAVNTTEALVVEARNLYETALISKQEYLEGTFLQERQTIESEVFVAEENLNRAKEYYEYSKRLAAKGYVNELQLEADKFAVEKSQKELDAAKTKLMVLEQFTKAKTLKQLESDIAIAKAKWESEKKSHQLEADKLEELQDQISKCLIKAPRAGIVTYAHEFDHRGGSEFVVQEGAVVRERQAIIRLPDPSSMRVQVTINESLVQYVKPGMPAKIVPVGLDLRLEGRVDNVNQYAEPGGWRKANVKEYKAFVSIVDPNDQLRSGMTASTTIVCASVPDALQVPVQAVYAHGSDYYCFVRDDKGWRAAKVTTGPTNDKFFVIESGLNEGDRVAMNPKRYLADVSLPPLSKQPAGQRRGPGGQGPGGQGPGGPPPTGTSEDARGEAAGQSTLERSPSANDDRSTQTSPAPAQQES
ncbi:MAG: HlyD family efflux transporter periplasmic adaptor subunit [Planctomycetales bacterium]|nr:HlyD family efflux transporter periplasmic adaptor subunit [Planctomycetales bacterium]